MYIHIILSFIITTYIYYIKSIDIGGLDVVVVAAATDRVLGDVVVEEAATDRVLGYIVGIGADVDVSDDAVSV